MGQSRYLHDNAHRRRIHSQLNKGEAIHALRKDIFYAIRSEIRKRHEHEHDTQTLCLNLNVSGRYDLHAIKTPNIGQSRPLLNI